MATDNDDAQTRDLYNALRTGDLGVSFETLMREIYFLQHRHFTLLDAKDAFHASTGKQNEVIDTRANERFLIYRDFQHAIVKLAKARYSTTAAAPSRATTDAQLAAALLTEIETSRQTRESSTSRMDSLRLQVIKHSALEVLEVHLPKLTQSFQLYGKDGVILAHTALANSQDTTSTISLDGFLDFLNAYFEYEDYVSFAQIEQMMSEMKDAFAPSLEPELEPHEMCFAHFLELFCRVASAFHNQLLAREGAQLRRAVESCRLEFSIELLVEHMDIKVLRDDTSSPATQQHHASSVSSADPSVAAVEPSLDGLTLEVESVFTNESKTLEAVIDDVRIHLEAFERTNASGTKRTKRAQSMLFARLPPRKVAPAPGSSTAAVLGGSVGVSDSIPRVTLIRELVSPPAFPSNVLAKLEHAITYQNMAQFHMALGALEKCKAKYKEWRESLALPLVDNDSDSVEARVFFHLTTASIFDSARRDFSALLHYVEALKLSDLLVATSSSSHSARALVKSSLGCALFYVGELGLAKKCHQHVLDARKHALGDDHIDTATAMNNLACCLSQDPTGTAMEEAYLLLKSATRIYSTAFGAAHPRVEVLQRNFERVKQCQRLVVVDPSGALERGEYTHVIPGSRFQIRALVPITAALSGKRGGSGKKKKKKKAKGGSGGKKKTKK